MSDDKRPRLSVGIDERADGFYIVTSVHNTPNAKHLNGEAGPYASFEEAKAKAQEAIDALKEIFPVLGAN